MKYTISIPALLLVALLQPWLAVIAHRETRRGERSFVSSNPIGEKNRFQNEVRAEAPDVLATDNPIRRVEFDSSGLQYLPRTEAGVQTESGFHYRLKSIASGESLYVADPYQQTILPAFEGAEVFYSHPMDILEKYRAVDAGLEQVFAVEREFNSNGDDLVILGEVRTDLQAKSGTRRGVTFCFEKEPVLRYGKVKVLDAAQREIAGQLHFEANELSIIISGDWLREATYPVTVSSLIYSSRAHSTTEPDSPNLFHAAAENMRDEQGTDQLAVEGADNPLAPSAGQLRPSVISGGVAPLLVPALVMGLRHNVNQERESGGYMAFFSARADAPVARMDGGDRGAALHRGYEWWMILDDRLANPASWKLPPGIALGLRHSQHQNGISVFGRDPFSGPSSFPGFTKQAGGDLGAPSGQGYYWYESTGEGFSDWRIVDRLPRWTVLGLKHSVNQKNKKFSWNGIAYDPANPKIAPPPGFLRKVGGDLGAPPGQGYCWYEKFIGPEVVVKPTLTVRLARSLLMSPADSSSLDQDHDSLVDSLENTLANALRPYCVFDSNETARLSGRYPGEPDEPVTLFQVRPVNLKRGRGALPLAVNIKWVFLFRRDGGYGPAASFLCGDSHEGDNDSGLYCLLSYDLGVTWSVFLAGLGDRGLEWPAKSRLEVYDLTHPIIYMSASKHHEYFTRDIDQDDSRYSDAGCNDNVNGRGDRILVNLQTPARLHGLSYNNVGEPEHIGDPFVNELSPFYTGHFAWGSENFYSGEAGPNNKKWLRGSWVR